MERAHAAALERLTLCEYVLDHINACKGECGQCPESPAFRPYCGCSDCVVRETLHAAFPVLAKHVGNLIAEELIGHGAAIEVPLGRVARSIRELEIR